MCDKAVDTCLPALKFVPDWSVTNKMLEKINVIFSNKNIVLVESDFVTFFSDHMGLNTINLDNINLDDGNFDDDPGTIIYVRLTAWHNKYKQHKSCKKI